MGKIQQANDYLQLKQQTDRDVRQLGVLAGEKYEADSTANQTVINLNFSITQTTEQKRGFQLYVDGQLLREGAANDYTFTGISGGTSAQVTLNAAIAAGLNIVAYKIGGYADPFPSPSSVQATLLNDVAQPHKMALAGFQPFVAKTLIAAPNTTIQNRALVESGSLKSIFGLERIPFKGLNLLRNEFGPSGQAVFEPVNGDSRVRFIGNWGLTSDSSGARPVAGGAGDSVEFTYYGTGLNVVWYGSENTTTNTISIDGSSAVALNSPSYTNFGGRNYAINQVYNLVSNQTLGWHTIKLVNVAGMGFQGIEILNERSNIATLPGVAYGGMKQETLASTSTAAFNAGVVGTRGARVVKYIQNGVVSQTVQEVNASAAYLASADHSNEEIIRRINFREFGANRGDDYSTLAGSASARAFVLDSGSDILAGSNSVVGTYGGSEVVYSNTTGNHIIITFVGTGLDFTRSDILNTGNIDSHTITIDGVLQGTLTDSALNLRRVQKICSGLPYGSHTVKIAITTFVASQMGIADFLVYGPKKPSIPSGAIEIADFNVVANYSDVANAATGFISQGTIRKGISVREAGYTGSWSISGTPDTAFHSGFNNGTSASGSTSQYTFFGTGFELRFFSLSGTNNSTLSVDGATNLSGFTTALTQTSTGATFTASTGVLGGSNAAGNRLAIKVTGLALGKHTIIITHNTTGQAYSDAIDIITPIHINSSNSKVGSLSLRDSRAFSPIVDKPNTIDLANAKAWCYLDSSTNKVLSSFNVSGVLVSSAGTVIIFYEKPFKNINYVAIPSVMDQVSLGASGSNYFANVSYKAANCTQVTIIRNDGTQTSRTMGFVAYGELEDEGEI